MGFSLSNRIEDTGTLIIELNAFFVEKLGLDYLYFINITVKENNLL